SFSRICTMVIISVNLWTGNSVSFWSFSIVGNTINQRLPQQLFAITTPAPTIARLSAILTELSF
ncbi:hypothetical protein, partial [Tumebacillus permanentifrigoris]|uniref:hypothetical protein n=1 Tax=Tumebacillus permanentifrigoris TaxID=378543 RepID=UPI001B86107B